MTELIRQLDKAAAETKARRSTVPEQVYAPVTEVTANNAPDGSDRSILVSIGIILGCVICGGILWALSAGSSPKDPVEHSSAVTPTAQPSVAPTADEKPAAQSTVAEARKGSTRSESKKNKSARTQKGDGTRFGRAYVLTE